MPEQKYKTVTKLSKDGKRFIQVKVPVKAKETTKKNSTDNRRTITETKLSKDGRKLVNVTRNNKSYNPDFKPGSTVYNSAGKAIKISDGKTFTGGDNVPSRPNIKKEKPAKPRKTQKVSSSIKSVKSSKEQTLGDTAKLKTSKATAATLKDLGLKSKPKEEPKKQVSNKERRQLNRAANLALRSGRTLEEAKALKEKRRTARKDYLRNFASYLARGEQATPRTSFGQGEGNPNASTSLVDNSPKGTEQEVKNNNEVAESEARNIENIIKIDPDPNKFLNDAFGISSSYNETEDLSPVTYMQKQYRKKRGY